MDQNGAKRYSTALFEVAQDSSKIEIFMKQMEELNTVFKDNRELMQILNHPNIQFKDKKDIVYKVLHGRIEDEIIGLLYVLLEHGKINEFIKVNLHYRDIVYQYKGIKIAYVTTAVKITDEEKEILKNNLSRQYACSIEIKNIIDPRIIGGVYLKVGDEVTDGTIRGNFEKMRKELLNQSVR